MAMSWKWCLGVALLGVTLLSHPVAAAKIERFKDTEGTLHIHNEGEEAAKPGGAVTPNTPPPPQPVPPPPQPVPPAPAPVPQQPEAAASPEQGEAPPGMQPESQGNPPAEQAAPEAQAEPGEGSSLSGTVPPSAAAWSAPKGITA